MALSIMENRERHSYPSLSFFPFFMYPITTPLVHIKDMLSSQLLLEVFEEPPMEIHIALQLSCYCNQKSNKQVKLSGIRWSVCCCSCAHVCGYLVLGEDVVKVLFFPECVKKTVSKEP